MRSIVIEKTGQEVKLESRIQAFVRGCFQGNQSPFSMLICGEKDRYHVKLAMRRTTSPNFTDKEAEIEFYRWASVLNEEIVLSIWKPGHRDEGHTIGINDMPGEDETIDEVKTVYEWGIELAELENTSMRRGDLRIERMKNIVRMMGDSKLFWPGGPKWWHQL